MANTAKVIDAFGPVERKVNANWKPVEVGKTLYPGFVIRTRTGGVALLQLQDGHRVRVGENTVLVLTKLGEGQTFALNVTTGQVWVLVRKAANPKSFKVETPSAASEVKGTLFAVALDPETGESVVDIAEGSVQVSTVGVVSGVRVMLRAGQLTRVPSGTGKTKDQRPKLAVLPHGTGSKTLWRLLLSEGSWAKQDGREPFALRRGSEEKLRRWWLVR